MPPETPPNDRAPLTCDGGRGSDLRWRWDLNPRRVAPHTLSSSVKRRPVVFGGAFTAGQGVGHTPTNLSRRRRMRPKLRPRRGPTDRCGVGSRLLQRLAQTFSEAPRSRPWSPFRQERRRHLDRWAEWVPGDAAVRGPRRRAGAAVSTRSPRRRAGAAVAVRDMSSVWSSWFWSVCPCAAGRGSTV
jgi:hypothetical protein